MLECMFEAVAVAAFPGDQDAPGDLRYTFVLSLLGLRHDDRIEDPVAGLKKTVQEKVLRRRANPSPLRSRLGKKTKKAAGVELHPPAAGWNQESGR